MLHFLRGNDQAGVTDHGIAFSLAREKLFRFLDESRHRGAMLAFGTALRALAERFDEVAVPKDGKYTRQYVNLKPVLKGEDVRPFALQPFDTVYVPEKIF